MFWDTDLASMIFKLIAFLLINAFLLMLIKFFYGKKPSEQSGENIKPRRRSVVLSMVFILLLIVLDAVFIIYMIPALRGLIEDEFDFVARLI